MKFISNPYLIGLSIIVVEWTTNFTISKMFDFDLGKNNLSAIVFFISAGYLIAYLTKKKMSRAYYIKIVLTYFLILSVILLISFLGQEISLQAILFVLGIFAILSIVSFFAMKFGQNLFLSNLKKTTEVNRSDSNGNSEN